MLYGFHLQGNNNNNNKTTIYMGAVTWLESLQGSMWYPIHVTLFEQSARKFS